MCPHNEGPEFLNTSQKHQTWCGSNITRSHLIYPLFLKIEIGRTRIQISSRKIEPSDVEAKNEMIFFSRDMPLSYIFSGRSETNSVIPGSYYIKVKSQRNICSLQISNHKLTDLIWLFLALFLDCTSQVPHISPWINLTLTQWHNQTYKEINNDSYQAVQRSQFKLRFSFNFLSKAYILSI